MPFSEGITNDAERYSQERVVPDLLHLSLAKKILREITVGRPINLLRPD